MSVEVADGGDLITVLFDFVSQSTGDKRVLESKVCLAVISVIYAYLDKHDVSSFSKSTVVEIISRVFTKLLKSGKDTHFNWCGGIRKIFKNF